MPRAKKPNEDFEITIIKLLLSVLNERTGKKTNPRAGKEGAFSRSGLGIHENLHVFWPLAQKGVQEFGRGGIVSDTTVPPVEHEGGKGHPFAYLPSSVFEKQGWEDVMRMVNQYDPTWKFVVVLLKPENRESAYRVGVPSQKNTDNQLPIPR